MSSDTFIKYADYYDLCNRDKPYKKEIEFVYKWAGKTENILDIGCGTASYWKYFPISMVGIDKSQSMIDKSPYKKNILCQDITKLKWFKGPGFDCVTALFDVINYIPHHKWWKKLPLKKGGYFIFDIWDMDKIERDGFKTTIKGNRIIEPKRKGNKVELKIILPTCEETHIMYLYSDKDIKKFCGKEFAIVDTKKTPTWQTWYKLVKR